MARNLCTVALLTVAVAALPAQAQQVTGVPGSRSATMTIKGDQLPPPPEKFGGKIERNAAQSTHSTQYFEMFGDHAIYHNGWIASTKVMRPPWETFGPALLDPAGFPWELYDLSKDWTQSENIDVGADTGTPVNDKDYQVPFKFSGKLDRLTLKIDRPELSEADKQRLMEAQRNNKTSE